jgi:Phosphopantothenoylcysteine synthetase/decarboxylase
MTILITAGPTSEKIDAVRRITNGATGRLGALVAESFCAGNGRIPDKIIYVCEKGAQEPSIAGPTKLEIVHTAGATELAATIVDILIREQPDAVIHSMAVSDYRVARVSDASGETLDTSKKLSSDLDSLVLKLERTPKIIGLIKPAVPKTILVGFKLLDSVSTETLVYAAAGLMRKNGCDFVFANDAREIEGDGHSGWLVYPDRTSRRIEGKKNIAREIAEETLALIAEKAGTPHKAATR